MDVIEAGACEDGVFDWMVEKNIKKTLMPVSAVLRLCSVEHKIYVKKAANLISFGFGFGFGFGHGYGFGDGFGDGFGSGDGFGDGDGFGFGFGFGDGFGFGFGFGDGDGDGFSNKYLFKK